jgi:hypothetical protein
MLNRHGLVLAVAAVLFCTAITREALAAPFQPVTSSRSRRKTGVTDRRSPTPTPPRFCPATSPPFTGRPATWRWASRARPGIRCSSQPQRPVYVPAERRPAGSADRRPRRSDQFRIGRLWRRGRRAAPERRLLRCGVHAGRAGDPVRRPDHSRLRAVSRGQWPHGAAIPRAGQSRAGRRRVVRLCRRKRSCPGSQRLVQSRAGAES